MTIDLRTAEGRALKPLLVPVALSLYGSGWTPYYIAEELGVATKTVSAFLRPQQVPGERDSQAQKRLRWRFERLAESRLDDERWEAEKFLLGRVRTEWEDIRARVRRTAAEKRHAKRALSRAPQLVSLDVPARLAYGSGSTGHDLVADSRFQDPAITYFDEQYREERLADILGDLQIEDVARLDEAHLDVLRVRLLEEGLVSIAVQRGERDRLREPQRHRGEAPAPLRERKSSRHRGRNEQRMLMAGKRTSRKQPKRWSREAA